MCFEFVNRRKIPINIIFFALFQFQKMENLEGTYSTWWGLSKDQIPLFKELSMNENFETKSYSDVVYLNFKVSIRSQIIL
jgi:hypothetical protein